MGGVEMSLFAIRVEDHVEIAKSKESAERIARRWAREIAEYNELDPDELEIYGGPDDIEWGCCPDGDPGSYYPMIEMVEP